MLVVGTSLMGIGEIFLEDGRVKLGPPQSGDRYFLTKLTKNQLMRQFQTHGTTFKVLSIIFGVVATGLLSFVIFRLTKKYVEHVKMRKSFEELRQLTLRRRAQGRDQEELSENQACVVCLTNPREVITLDCGHIAMCSDCAQKDFFQLKDLERMAPKEKGITSQSVKEVVQSLVDDAMDERSTVMSDLQNQRNRKQQLEAELAKYRESDPEVLEKQKRETDMALEAANRWTDNVFSIKSWVQKKFCCEESVIDKQFDIPSDFDYLE
nr:hypothetical protein BaRGS_006612 [Batillaria attramentaria]